jgi:RHS repeat-associated protein
MQRLDQRFLLALSGLLLAVVARPCVAQGTKVTVTKYTYNADGALTSTTVTPDDGTPATTTYLTWDNFTPDTADPTTGTTAVANGRLLGFGPSPDNLTTTFQFDVRDRLKNVVADGQSEDYDYHAKGTMASSSTNGDSLQFYYDTSKNAQVTNIYQTSQDMWSGYLGHVRYLDDGTEQILLKPRKDMACSYDADQQALAPYAYDAFGAQSKVPAVAYDLRDNPFQYAGEYRDPVWGGYYLRARWYHPDLPVFLSRDPMHNLNRYGYGGGNPVMHTDPSGMSFLKTLGRGIEKGAGKLSALLNRGWYGHLDRFFLAPLMAPLQFAANPRAFWQGIKTDKDGIDIFIAASIVANVGFDLAASYSESLSAAEIYVARSVTNLTIGTAGVVASAADRGFKHFNWTTLTNGVEGVAGSYFDLSLVGGAGYNHRFNLEADEVRNISSRLRFNEEEEDDVVILRRRVRTKALGVPLPKNVGPLAENASLGLYHEQLIAITRDNIFTTEVLGGEVVTQTLSHDTENLESILGGASGKDFGLAGRIDGLVRSPLAVDGFEGLNPLNLRSAYDPEGASRYSYFRNNSSLHTKAILQNLGMW